MKWKKGGFSFWTCWELEGESCFEKRGLEKAHRSYEYVGSSTKTFPFSIVKPSLVMGFMTLGGFGIGVKDIVMVVVGGWQEGLAVSQWNHNLRGG